MFTRSTWNLKLDMLFLRKEVREVSNSCISAFHLTSTSGVCVCVCEPVPCQIPELLLSKTAGGVEENDREKAARGKSLGRMIMYI